MAFNTDDPAFGGTGLGDLEPLKSEYIPCHGLEQSISVDLPPMGAVILRCTKKFPPRRKKAELSPAAKPVAKRPGRKKAPAAEAPSALEARRPARSPHASKSGR